VWKWKDTKGWEPYDSWTCDYLESAYQKEKHGKKSKVDLRALGGIYSNRHLVVDLEEMCQINTETNTRRVVSRDMDVYSTGDTEDGNFEDVNLDANFI